MALKNQIKLFNFIKEGRVVQHLDNFKIQNLLKNFLKIR